MSGVTKMAWDVMSGVTKTAWDVLSGVANLCGMFCPGCKKMAWDVLSWDVLSGSHFFCGSFMFLFCLVFAMFCACLFICALRSPAGKGLTSWLSFVVSTVSLSLSRWYPGPGVVLNCIDS